MATPHATTKEQVEEMESEGQAQTHASSEADGLTDQDIDTAGTEADPLKSQADGTTTVADEQLVEAADDTDSDDIVGPTGEAMPKQKHEGIDGPPSQTRH